MSAMSTGEGQVSGEAGMALIGHFHHLEAAILTAGK
jgi:hypothetical protein